MKCHKGKYSWIKMNNHTVVQLKVIAKERGVRGYYNLRKAELIHVLEAIRFVEQTSNIFDESISNDPTPVLQPTPWRPSNVTTKDKQNRKQKIIDFGEWLLNYIQPKPKVVDKVVESFKNKIKKMYEKRDTLFQPTQSKSAIQYGIKGSNGYDPESFLLKSKQPITSLMINTRQTKVKLILSCMMEKVDLKSDEVIAKDAAFHSKTEVNLESTDSNELFSKMKETILESLAKFQRQGSNWRFHSVLSLDLHTVKYEPLGGSSYNTLPKFLAAKKAIINHKNEDDECFKWAITRAQNPVENHPERIDRELRENSKVLNWKGLKFPVNLSDINKLENHNSSISINVFGFETLIYPLRISKHTYKRQSTVNLLLISDDTNNITVGSTI